MRFRARPKAAGDVALDALDVAVREMRRNLDVIADEAHKLRDAHLEAVDGAPHAHPAQEQQPE